MSTEETTETASVQLSGRYESDTGTLNIKPIDKQSAGFDILVATAAGCTGEISGNLVFQDPTHAKYSDGTCSLKFVFGHHHVEVIEDNCDEHHGIACPFSGRYERIR